MQDAKNMLRCRKEGNKDSRAFIVAQLYDAQNGYTARNNRVRGYKEACKF